jgi:hypothetical protein
MANVDDLKKQLLGLGVSPEYIDAYLADKTKQPDAQGHYPLVDNAKQKERLALLANRIQTYSGSIEAQRKAVDLFASQSTLDELNKAVMAGTAPVEAVKKYFETLKTQADALLAETQQKAIAQKIGKIIKDETGVDLSDADGLEELAKSGKLYKILSERADLSAQDVKTFGESIQSIAGARKSVIDVITAAAQAKKSVAEADAIARKFAPTLAKVGIGDGTGLLSFSAAIDDGSLMKRIEKLTTMVGQDGLNLKDVQEITQTVKGLLEAHQLEAVAKYAEIKQEAEARSAHVQAGFREKLFGPDGKRNLDDLSGLTPAGPGYLRAKLSISPAEAPTAEKNTGTAARHWPEIPIPGSN